MKDNKSHTGGNIGLVYKKPNGYDALYRGAKWLERHKGRGGREIRVRFEPGEGLIVTAKQNSDLDN